MRMSLSRKVRFLLSLFVILPLLGAILVSLIPFLISNDAIRLRLSRDLSLWTGYNVELGAIPHISIFPYFQASLADVTLTDAAEGGVPLMKAKHIEVDLSLYDAFFGKIRFSETRIIDPNFIIDEPIKTVASFFNSLAHSQGTLGVSIREAKNLIDQSQAVTALQQLSQPFGHIIIKNGTLTYRINEEDDHKGEMNKITHIYATISWPESTGLATLQASAHWRDAFTNLDIQADQALLLLAGGTSPLRFSVNSNRGGITFSGKGHFSKKFFLDGQIESRSPNWSQSMHWIGKDAFFGNDITAPFVWTSSFKAWPEQIEMNNISFTLGEDRARGALNIHFQENIPIVLGSLAFESLTLDPLISLPIFHDRALFNPAILKHFGLDLRLSIAQSILHSISISDLAASIQLRDGNFIFDIGYAKIFDGIFQTNLQLQHNPIQSDSQPAEMTLHSRVSANSIHLQKLQQIWLKTPILDTKATLHFIGQSDFTNWRDVVSHSQGTLSVNFDSGHLENFDMDRFNQHLQQMTPFLFSMTDKNQRFSFNKFDSKITLNNGKLYVNSAILSFKEQDLDFSGWIDPLENSLHIKAILNNPRKQEGKCFQVQCMIRSLSPLVEFSIRGQWPQFTVIPIHYTHE